jgi:hypothetical protein
MTYKVLKPQYAPTGYSTDTAGGPIGWQRVTWRCVGAATSMEDALKQGHIHPVLEWAGDKPLKLVEFGAPKSAVSAT